ncbi:MAG: hypothetical protein QOD81_4075 [Solirubrobacteraceae bacterium]|jgi:hypothetical protein|nr:hypothetical protein [Solirubrobacteraceae bacterium]
MRASDRDRERALALLRARCAEGYLSIDTFERRVELTLTARTAAELRGLVADVGRARPGWSRGGGRPGTPSRSRPGATPPVELALPVGDPLVVGRSSRCGAVLGDPTVSRRHVELRPVAPDRWVAVDLGSLNGTWLLGRRVARVRVGPGDELRLGSCRVALR